MKSQEAGKFGPEQNQHPFFFGPAFDVGDEVQFADPKYHGYDEYSEFSHVDVFGVFNVVTTETQFMHGDGIGVPDRDPDYEYQTVVVEELPGWEFAADRFKSVDTED